ncbi:unnamed protein product, partial [Schistosoma turkestanicum]
MFTEAVIDIESCFPLIILFFFYCSYVYVFQSNQVYVDTVGKAEHYEAKLQNIFPQLKIRVESKADDTYPIVSAASIFAK